MFNSERLIAAVTSVVVTSSVCTVFIHVLTYSVVPKLVGPFMASLVHAFFHSAHSGIDSFRPAARPLLHRSRVTQFSVGRSVRRFACLSVCLSVCPFDFLFASSWGRSVSHSVHQQTRKVLVLRTHSMHLLLQAWVLFANQHIACSPRRPELQLPSAPVWCCKYAMLQVPHQHVAFGTDACR